MHQHTPLVICQWYFSTEFLDSDFHDKVAWIYIQVGVERSLQEVYLCTALWGRAVWLQVTQTPWYTGFGHCLKAICNFKIILHFMQDSLLHQHCVITSNYLGFIIFCTKFLWISMLSGFMKSKVRWRKKYDNNLFW